MIRHPTLLLIGFDLVTHQSPTCHWGVNEARQSLAAVAMSNTQSGAAVLIADMLGLTPRVVKSAGIMPGVVIFAFGGVGGLGPRAGAVGLVGFGFEAAEFIVG
jgi:hypothetical protein